MSPFPSPGRISFTKFTSPEGITDVLAGVVPGVTTAAEVLQDLAAAKLADPLWDDLLSYDPPFEPGKSRAAGSQVAVDNELLRACREGREDRFLLLWAQLILADPRLDAIVREVFTDSTGKLVPEMVNASKLGAALTARHAADPDEPHDTKAVSNLLSLLERCRLVEPVKHGKTIVGVERVLPTAHAVPAVVRLIGERLAERGFGAQPGRELDLALALGANAWLNLTASEFRDAFDGKTPPAAQPQSVPGALPEDLKVIATLLRRKGQVLLQGPPGAGKTYVARRYVDWVSAGRRADSRLQSIVEALPDDRRTVPAIADEIVSRGLSAVWDIVQFHPGYEYTDFVRALVAQPHGQGVTFVAQHRIFSLVCAVGAELARRGYELEMVLILDELNRGDIPSIFGELLYALEYREEPVASPYTVDGTPSLTVPHNVRVIGTMNTADRSIAVIDCALRRRFTPIDLEASDSPIRGYTGFDDETAREAALYLYERTRDALSEASQGLQVGPSYFLAEPDGEDGSIAVLATRFVYEVLPLLDEYTLEGEVDASRVESLRQELGLGQRAKQWDQGAALAAHLVAGQPWKPAAADPEVGEPEEALSVDLGGPLADGGDAPASGEDTRDQ